MESPHLRNQDAHEHSSLQEEAPALEMRSRNEGTSSIAQLHHIYCRPTLKTVLRSVQQALLGLQRVKTPKTGLKMKMDSKNRILAFGSNLTSTTKTILFSSCLNTLLIFVPLGILVEATHQSASVVFTINAIAIIPLSSLLSYATECVASSMGDTLGALLNVTFGNAVELVIFTALSKSEIRIVQASLLGSILVNLLLILGMAFFIGGLRYREQVYNSTVTQMSSCLLSLSVMSLLLPTAFHASFKDVGKADDAVLKVSRGTSVVLLLIYGLYLLFQLRSHAYMYEGTAQYILDDETMPGPAAHWIDFPGSEDTYSDSEDSNTSRHNNRGALMENTSVNSSGSDSDDAKNSKQQPQTAGHMHKSTIPAQSIRFSEHLHIHESNDDDHTTSQPRLSRISDSETTRRKARQTRTHNHRSRSHTKKTTTQSEGGLTSEINSRGPQSTDGLGRIDTDQSGVNPTKRSFSLRSISVQPSRRRPLSRSFFMPPQPFEPFHTNLDGSTSRHSIRRVRSISCSRSDAPDRRISSLYSRPSLQLLTRPTIEFDEKGEDLSRLAAVILLLISTTVVAICADFMVDAIDDATSGTFLSATFVGLIILPIVGNAAEFITAVTVAAKNKMDLAIAVAIGSSIQIALFLTPLVLLLAWCMGKQLTLHFSLFETVSLFVSAFIVNFLVLDGRSNYMEGALLMAAYVIVSIAAFYFPDEESRSILEVRSGGHYMVSQHVATNWL